MSIPAQLNNLPCRPIADGALQAEKGVNICETIECLFDRSASVDRR
jgi:hypothetical protein